MYAVIDDLTGNFVVGRYWRKDRIATISAEIWRMDDLNLNSSFPASGLAMVVDEILLDPHAWAFAQLEILASLAIPLAKSSQMVALMSVHNDETATLVDPAAQASAGPRVSYSHSIVAGGLLLTS